MGHPRLPSGSRRTGARPDKLVLGEFAWRDDFAAARNHADSLATGDWLAWTDLDDSIYGAQSLQSVVANAPADAAYLMALYIYDLRNPDASARPGGRVYRRGSATWTCPVHEYKRLAVDGLPVMIDPNIIRWEHRAGQRRSSIERNLRIARAWAERCPEDPLAGYLVKCSEAGLAGGNHATAYAYLQELHERASGEVREPGPRELVPASA